MNTGFRSQCVPEYRLLTEDQIEEIHLATLEVLESVGVWILDKEGVQLLRAAGCRVKKDNIVHIPNWLVEECIRTAPSPITVYNRKGDDAMPLEGNKVSFGYVKRIIRGFDINSDQIGIEMIR